MGVGSTRKRVRSGSYRRPNSLDPHGFASSLSREHSSVSGDEGDHVPVSHVLLLRDHQVYLFIINDKHTACSPPPPLSLIFSSLTKAGCEDRADPFKDPWLAGTYCKSSS